MPNFATQFNEPPLFPNYPSSLGIVVDAGTVALLFFETRYYDIEGTLLEITSTPIPTNQYGQLLHLTNNYAILKNTSYCEVDIQDVDNTLPGTGERYEPCIATENLLPDWNSLFPSWEGVKFRGYLSQISLVVDAAFQQQVIPEITETIDDTNNLFNFSVTEQNEPLTLYYERKYLDINREVLGIHTSLIPESAYGQLSRFTVPYVCCLSAVWVQCTIVDTDTSTAFDCPELLPENEGTYEYTEQEHNELEYN